MKKLSIVTLFLLSSFLIKAQVNIDSLKSVADKYPNDTGSIHKLQDLASDFVATDNNATLEILKIAEKKLADKKSIQMAKIYTSIANAQTHLSNMPVASQFYAKAKIIAESLADSNVLSKIYLGEGAMHFENRQTEIALSLFKKALLFCNKDNLRIKSSIIGNIGATYFTMSQRKNNVGRDGAEPEKLLYDEKYLKKAIPYTMQALEIAKQMKSKTKQILQSTNLCQQYMYMDRLDSAKYYLDFAEKIVKEENTPNANTAFYSVKGEFLTYKKDYLGSIEAFTKSKDEALKIDDPKFVFENYYQISKSYEHLKDYKKSLEFYKKYTSLRDSSINKENYAAATDIQNKYESAKKEKEIIKLNADNKEKSTQNKILIGLTFGLLALAFLGYRNFKNRQEIATQQQTLQEQKITELEKDQQLQSIDSMLKGQEDERNRIAKDLHDGLGGMLSGVKMSFMNMKENLIMSSENVTIFERSISQLDNTISELRKIAHNLMPEALVRFGLNDAIKDFCTSMTTATHINIVYESMGKTRELDNTANVYIYRIIQELVNNAIKHGQPNQVFVQLTTTPNKILITVEDDGKGLNINELNISKGIGISNIKHRVNYFKGLLEFDAKSPNGTVVNIELNV